jgi:hypothetical protein
MGWPLRASIERTDRILVYEPSKSNSLSSTEAWLKPTASLAVRGEKLGGGPQIGQSACWGCSWESLFLRSSEICPNLSVTHERLLYVDHVRYIWSRVIHGLSVESMWYVRSDFPLQGVYQFESPWLSDISTAYLWQLSRSNLMNLIWLM